MIYLYDKLKLEGLTHAAQCEALEAVSRASRARFGVSDGGLDVNRFARCSAQLLIETLVRRSPKPKERMPLRHGLASLRTPESVQSRRHSRQSLGCRPVGGVSAAYGQGESAYKK